MRNIKKSNKFVDFLILVLTVLVIYNGYQLYKIHTTPQQNQKQTTINPITNKPAPKKTYEKVIKQELNEIRELIVLEGVIDYNTTLQDKKWYGTKEANISLKYKYYITSDLSTTEVYYIEDGDYYTLQIPLENFHIKLELMNEQSTMESKATWFSKGYTAEDIKWVIDQSRKKVIEQLQNDKTLHEKARTSLEKTAYDILKKFNINNVKVEWM